MGLCASASASESTPSISPPVKALADGPSFIVGGFKPSEVAAFQEPVHVKNKFVFFLSHRGPDTKKELVLPLSVILRKLGVPAFFDQKMEFGESNADQMAEAAWSSRVGVVVISDHFAESKWCLRELNTFLKRRREHSCILVPVYFSSALLESPLYRASLSFLSAAVRKPSEPVYEFLVRFLPDLLNVAAIQDEPAIQNAQEQLKAHPQLIKRLWNQYAKELVPETERKLFSDPDLEVENLKETLISKHRSLLPSDIRDKLDIYESLQYSLLPRTVSSKRDDRNSYELDSLTQDLLQGRPLTLQSQKPVAEDDQENKLPPINTKRTSTFHIVVSPTVLLIQGPAGSGKSLFGWHLFKSYPGKSLSTPIPLFLSLPVYRDLIVSQQAPQLMDKYFSETFHFSQNDVHSLRHQAFVFILDGLDELGVKLNLYEKCELSLWSRSTFIISSRSEYLSETDVNEYITPLHPLTKKPETALLAKIYLLPFTERQRERFVDKFARNFKSMYRWEAKQYIDCLSSLPQLQEFVKEPMLLFMVLHVLPQLQSHNAQSQLTRLDLRFLEVRAQPDPNWTFPTMRRAELYALFVQGWAMREIERLAAASKKPTVRQVLTFCQRLAFDMFLHGKVAVLFKDTPAVSRELEEELPLYEQEEMKEQQQKANTDQWAFELFKEHNTERCCSPLRRSGDIYSFLHKSLQEYFAASLVGAELTAKVVRGDRDGSWEKLLQDPSTISSLRISQKTLTHDYAVIRFAAELVDPRIRGYIHRRMHSDDSQEIRSFQPLGRALFDLLQANHNPIANANALTILNAGGVSFSGRDFTDLKIGGIGSFDNSSLPTADLSCAMLTGCVFRNAKMTGVRLEDVCLDKCQLQGADLSDAIFGQKPMFLGHTAGIRALALSSDGKTLFSGSEDKTICQWAVNTSSLVRKFEGHSRGVLSLALSSDGRILFSASDDDTIREWAVDSGSLVHVFEGRSQGISCLVLSPDDKTLFSGSCDNSIRQWSVTTGSLIRALDGHSSSVLSLALSCDGKALFSGSWDSTIRQWDVDTGSLIRVLEGHLMGVSSLALSCDGKNLFSGSWDSTIRQWAVDSGSLVSVLEGHSGTVSSLALSFDSTVLFSGSDDKTLREWSIETCSLTRVLEAHSQGVLSLTLSSDGKTLLSGSEDNTIREWTVDTSSSIRAFDGHSDGVWHVALSPDGKTLYSGSEDKTIREWAIDSGSMVRLLEGHSQGVSSLALSSDGKTLFSGSWDKSIREWALHSGVSVRTFEGHAQGVSCLVLSADDRTLFSGSRDNTIRQWITNTGSWVRTFEGHTQGVLCLALSADGKNLFSGSYDSTIRHWGINSGSLVRILQGHSQRVRSLELSHDGKYLFSGSWDKSIRQWAVETGSVVRVFEGHSGSVLSLVLSPDGKSLFSGSWDNSIRQWDVDTSSLIRVLEGHSLGILRLVVSSDGKTLFSGSDDKTVRQWAVDATSTPASVLQDGREEFSTAGLCLWSSGPWRLSALGCQFDEATKLTPSDRLLIQQHGAHQN